MNTAGDYVRIAKNASLHTFYDFVLYMPILCKTLSRNFTFLFYSTITPKNLNSNLIDLKTVQWQFNNVTQSSTKNIQDIIVFIDGFPTTIIFWWCFADCHLNIANQLIIRFYSRNLHYLDILKYHTNIYIFLLSFMM